MDKLIQLLKSIDITINWEEEKKLIDDRILDSLTLIILINEFETVFNVQINATEIIPENFNSAEAMWRMLTRLQEK